ncbi:hypothetical protein NLJ89_g1488 [Agrocybe chaxingu]|uniref:DUF6533 domain-containing protein n=1 Tax=Agrocybe chaxingu TaxID=84603 RepID=A0A9W8TF46_9AGAR|nr:hypothetical protein NLJ89_g1488 [Agrocybe chaxingu]
MDVAGAAAQAFVKKVVATTSIKMVNGALERLNCNSDPKLTLSHPSTTVAAFALLFYDYLLTLGMEVEHVWPGEWTPVKVVYLVQRYLPFVDTMLLEAQSQSRFRIRRMLHTNASAPLDPPFSVFFSESNHEDMHISQQCG